MATELIKADVLIVGGGIAGASLGAEIAGERRCLLVEAEPYCAMHATGRSAAFWLESYGGPGVAPLTRASREFLQSPPAEFAGRPFLSPRVSLWIADSSSVTQLDAIAAVAETLRLDRKQLEQLIPGVRERWQWGLHEPSCADIDVAGLHAAYLRQFRRRGGEVRCDAKVREARQVNSGWQVQLDSGERIETRILVNAAGAWADQVATIAGLKPIGIAPKRRTMVQLRVGRGGLSRFPLVNEASGQFYFKGEGDRSLWLSPHDEIASDPCDAQPEEEDVAIAIDRFQQAVDWPVEAVERKWAGLRSFAPDRLPVYGFDPRAPGFFWCAGQGGFGIQTAPAAARMAAALLLQRAPHQSLRGIDPKTYSPARFR